jgi:small subunit ribosomal protein S20
MANHSATKKSIRKTIIRTAINKSKRSRVKTFIKKVETAILDRDVEKANQAFIKAQSEIMKGVSANLVKKNAASRKISRLAKRIKNILA